MDQLETIASLSVPPTSKTANDVVKAFHGACDKHVFRTLAIVSDQGAHSGSIMETNGRERECLLTMLLHPSLPR
jgi:hypothetical protein